MHPVLTKWLKRHTGIVALGQVANGDWHLITDDAGRGSLRELISEFTRLEYRSGVRIALTTPNDDIVDGAVQRLSPHWLSEAKIVGGGEESDFVQIVSGEHEIARLPKTELERVLSRPNHGNDEYHFHEAGSVWVW